MAHYYLDSSAFVKRYVAESGTPWVRDLFDPSAEHVTYTVRISGAEIVTALFTRARTGSLAPAAAATVATRFRADFERVVAVVEVTREIVERAMDLATQRDLRGYDSVQLAAALAVHEVRETQALPPLTFVCADARLNQAAAAEGLGVINPDTVA